MAYDMICKLDKNQLGAWKMIQFNKETEVAICLHSTSPFPCKTCTLQQHMHAQTVPNKAYLTNILIIFFHVQIKSSFIHFPSQNKRR